MTMNLTQGTWHVADEKGTSEWFCISMGQSTQIVKPWSTFTMSLTVVPEGSSGSHVVVRALLDCVVSALEYSCSICRCDRQKKRGGGCKSRTAAGAVVPARMVKSLCCPCTYLTDEDFRKCPHQDQHHHHHHHHACTSCRDVWL